MMRVPPVLMGPDARHDPIARRLRREELRDRILATRRALGIEHIGGTGDPLDTLAAPEVAGEEEKGMSEHDDRPIRHVRIGPLHVGFRRRREPIPEWVEFGDAVRNLGREIAAFWRLDRLCRWLDRRLTR